MTGHGAVCTGGGTNETKLEEGPVVGGLGIERETDSKGLGTFVVKADGPNSDRFTYLQAKSRRSIFAQGRWMQRQLCWKSSSEVRLRSCNAFGADT